MEKAVHKKNKKDINYYIACSIRQYISFASALSTNY